MITSTRIALYDQWTNEITMEKDDSFLFYFFFFAFEKAWKQRKKDTSYMSACMKKKKQTNSKMQWNEKSLGKKALHIRGYFNSLLILIHFIISFFLYAHVNESFQLHFISSFTDNNDSISTYPNKWTISLYTKCPLNPFQCFPRIDRELSFNVSFETRKKRRKQKDRTKVEFLLTDKLFIQNIECYCISIRIKGIEQ